VRRALLLALVALLAAGCSGGGDEESSGTTATATPEEPADTAARDAPVDGGTAADEPGEVLLRFVRAAGESDDTTMWNLLTAPTQAAIGPTLDDFRGEAGESFKAGLGSIAENAEVILSRRLADDWSVAAVAGERIGDDGEPEEFAYGAALLPENGQLKIELGGVVVTGFKPDPSSETDEPQPDLAANVGAGGDLTEVQMWLDGEPFPAERGKDDTPFTATLRGKPARPLSPGRHHVVVFASTGETATATAWLFTVEDDG
jgi:hypothetical protein